jgi:hypothetical protein
MGFANSYLNLINDRKSISDFQKLQEEFDLRKAQAQQENVLRSAQVQKIQNELATPDIESLAQQSLYDYHQGKPMTPQGRAAIETLATLKGSSVKYSPDEFGTVRAISEPNPFQQFLGQSGGGQRMPQMSQPPQPSTMKNYGNDFSVEPLDIASIEAQLGNVPNVGGQVTANSPAFNMPVRGGQPPSQLSNMAFDPQYAPQLDKQIAESPFGRKAIFEKQLKLMEDMNNPSTEIGKMQLDEKRGLVPLGSTEMLIKEKSRQTRKEDMALQKEEAAIKQAEEQAKFTKTTVENKIKKAFALLKKNPFASGRLATLGGYLPGKSAPIDTIAADYSTITSNLAMDKLMQLKAASPTGASGFGALSEKELMIISDYASRLDPELPYDQQVEALREIARMMKLDVPELTGGAANSGVDALINQYAD